MRLHMNSIVKTQRGKDHAEPPPNKKTSCVGLFNIGHELLHAPYHLDRDRVGLFQSGRPFLDDLRLSGNVNVRMKGQLAPNLGDQFADFNHQIFTALRDSPGTQPYLFTKRGVALGMYEQLGKPQFLLTLTCQRQNESMLRVKTDHILKGCRGSCVMPT